MRTPAKILVSIIAVAFFFTVASSARADSFNWTYTDTTSASTGGTNVTASGTLTTGAFSGGHATITGITGTVNGTAIASLLSTSPGFGSNDNILFYPGTPYLDDLGVSFSLTGGDNVNMYYGNGVYNMFDSVYFNTGGGINSYEASFTLTPVGAPEPGTMLLLAIGLLGLAALQWRRKARSAVLQG